MYVHVIGWDQRGRNLTLELGGARSGGVPAREIEAESEPQQAEDRSLMELLFSVERRALGPLTFNVVVEWFRGNGLEVLTRVSFEIPIVEGL